MKVLLGATVALLLGALAISWQNMRNGVSNASEDEIARLKKQIAELDHIAMQRKLQEIQAAAPAAPAAPQGAEIEAMREKIAAQEAALNAIEQERKGQRDEDLERDEEGLIAQHQLESKDGELKRAKRIVEALLVARVKEYVKDSQFITFEVLMPEAGIQPGAILAVRRKTGILGTFKVASVEPEGGIANLLPGFGEFEPKPGDDLIFPPQF